MDIGSNVSVGIAFIAGFLSFISPCVLPLVPAYIGYLGGRATIQASQRMATPDGQIVTALETNRLGLFFHGLMFVAGFTFVFVGFGILTNMGIQALARNSYDFQLFLARAGGVLVIFFGLHVMGVTGWLLRMLITRFDWDATGDVGKSILRGLERLQGILYSDTRRQINPRNPYGYAGSGLMGMIFAAGWSPCIGPILGTILTMAANQHEIQASSLLLAYSLGLGVPFLLAALALNQMRGFLKRLQRQMRAIEIISGAFLIMIGVLLYTNELSIISSTLGNQFTMQAGNLESCTVGVIQGQIPSGDYGKCMQLGPNYNITPIPPQSMDVKPELTTQMQI